MYTTPEKDQIGINENKLAQTVSAAFIKCIIIICITVLGGMTLHSCNVDSDTIISCQESCEASGNMKSVSRFSCTCQEIKGASSPFVIDSKLAK
jgi:hypothetical protein|tara:strand:+ start:294 stop:575 length:282 start_codon:yes stop_codon:yes gene_type:complete